MDIIHFFLFLVVSAVCAGIAARVVPGIGRNGFLAGALVGIVGAWIGESVMGPIGPKLEGVPILPAIIGSGIFIFALSLISRLFRRGQKKN
ncbi:GlsB/YeaQ/YmgE family stress response membrane protein [bacterium]|nr:GlsB/YeaQ/YmgE family stress response membrane protein [bacterium]